MSHTVVKIFCHVRLCEGKNRCWPRNEGWERSSYYQGFILSQGDGCKGDVGGNGSKHIKGTINPQLQKFTPLGLVSWVTVIYFAPWGKGEKWWGLTPLGLFLLNWSRIIFSHTNPYNFAVKQLSPWHSNYNTHTTLNKDFTMVFIFHRAWGTCGLKWVEKCS